MTGFKASAASHTRRHPTLLVALKDYSLDDAVFGRRLKFVHMSNRDTGKGETTEASQVG